MTDTTIYAVFDREGAPRSFYPSDVFGPQESGERNAMIPGDAVEISAFVYRDLLDNQPWARFKGGKVTKIKPPEPKAPPPNPLEDIRAALASISRRLDALEEKR